MEAELKAAYLAILGSDNALRKQAEQHLRNCENSIGFFLVNMQLISALPTTPMDAAVRQSAAVLFKNIVKRRWVPADDTEHAIILADKNVIKTNLVGLMCSTPPDIQKQLAEVVSVVANHDFPGDWLNLLPQLVEKLNTADYRIIQGVMLTANSIFKKFRYVYKTNELMEQLKYCLQLFESPLLEVFKSAGTTLASLQDKDLIVIVIETLRLMCRIYFSLNWQDIPEFFEDNISVWMGEFSRYLSYKNPLLINMNEEYEPGPIEKLQAAIVENLSLYVSKYEEEFAPHLPSFTQLIWQLLMEVSSAPKYDNLATQAIKFLTCVSSKKANSPLFTDTVVRDIIEQIVIRNLTASSADEELFADNPTDYIRKDMEGSDQDTRRRCATELIRSLMKFAAGPTSTVCLTYISNMLSEYNISKDWKAKDAALHLVLAVAASSASVAQGVGEINTSINLIEIFNLHIIPELQDKSVNARPIVKTDAIKMLCMFRNQLDTSMLLALLPDIIRHLNSKYVVVQTYAALTIEKLLSLKVKGDSNSAVRITKDHLSGHLQAMFQGLFAVLDNPDLPENDYVMKCVMRLLVVMGQDVTPVTALVLNKLMVCLERVCKNPANPHFNHYMFECIAVLIRSCCTAPAPGAALAACSQFESLLFPPFQSILSLDVVEFIPYVFQLLAELLSYRPLPGLSDPYKVLITPLMTPVLWERKGNAPALTDLIIAYITKGFQDIEAANCLQPLLGVFQKLLSSKTTEKLALKLLTSLFAKGTHASLSPYVATIWQLLMTKLQDPKNISYPKLFFHTLAIYAIHYGGNAAREVLEGISAGVVSNLIAHVWIPNALAMSSLDDLEVRELLLGGTRLLCDSAIVQDAQTWGSLFKCLVVLLDTKGNQATEIVMPDDEAEDRGFDSAYSKLAFCQLPELEHSGETAHAHLIFVTSVATLSQTSPGKYAGIIQASLDANETRVFGAIVMQAGVAIA